MQDTYTLIRKGIQRVLKAGGYQAPAKRRGLATNLAVYLEGDRKADIDWYDPAARAAQLKVLVADAQAVLDLVVAESDDAEVRAAGWLLTRTLSDDVVTDEHGDPQIGRGVAPDRIESLTDPEMRHRHTRARPSNSTAARCRWLSTQRANWYWWWSRCRPIAPMAPTCWRWLTVWKPRPE